MATPSKNLGTKQFRITAEDTPITYQLYMQYPVEVTECWANVSEGRKIGAGVNTSVGEILENALFKMIGDAFMADGAAAKDLNAPSGLKPVLGDLRSSGLSKLEKIKVAALKAKYIAHLAEEQGEENISGGHATSGIIPMSIALKVKDMLTKATERMLSSGKLVGDNDVCHVRMCALLQIDPVEKEG
ncbi:MAG: hypothetical protein OYH77_07410 [Pseudomonadota bacterium]|nr:hypothetical protein [Pseudomonadota bacterium]